MRRGSRWRRCVRRRPGPLTNDDAAYAGRWLFTAADGLGGQLRQIIENHTIGNLACNVWLARASARTAPGRQARPSG